MERMLQREKKKRDSGKRKGLLCVFWSAVQVTFRNYNVCCGKVYSGDTKI
jgi:hypothetical protein